VGGDALDPPEELVNLVSQTWQYLSDPASWQGSQGIWVLLVQQLLLSVTALAVAAVIGLPLALWLGHLGRGSFLAINVSNMGRAIPTFALLAILVTTTWPGTETLGPYGRAGISTLIALTLFALPPIITNANVAVREVPGPVKESALGMGMTGWQLFWRVELPLALPLVASGLRLALVQVWATATIAALVAGPGLGRIITDGFYNVDYGKGLGGAVVVAAVAFCLELLGAVAERAADPARRAADRPADRGGARVAASGGA
jgi:osmoprotectant transport system permease protein